MHLIDSTRGVSFRIAALTTVLVLASMVVLGGLVYSFVDQVMQDRVRRRIEDEMATLLVNPQAARREWLVAEIARRTAGDIPRSYAYRLVTTDGTHVMGDVWIKATQPGWSTEIAPNSAEARMSVKHIVVLTAQASDGVLLSIGRDVHWIADVESELLHLLLWALAAGVVLASVTSYVAQQMVARRLEIVSDSAQAIMDGDLRRRIPLTGANDDFDHLSVTLNGMLDRIKSLMEDLEQVTNDIAHDLRTPLSRLRHGLEVARAEATSTEAYGRAVDRAIAEADGLLVTFTSLLRIAQIEAGARRLAFRDVDLSDVMRSVSDAYQLSAEDSGHRLAARIADGAWIKGDRDLIVQAFANLIENGLAHTSPGTTITVSLDRSDSEIIASVADDGDGVPEAEREKIFRRFYRRETSRSTPGTGLGLSLVAAVARLHNARIAASDNHPGLGIDLIFLRVVARPSAP